MTSLTMFAAGALIAVVTPNQFGDSASDSAAIQAAVDFAAKRGEAVTVPAWNERTGTNVWVISETVRLPSGSTVYLDNCRLEMAPKVFCNAFSNSKAWTDDRNAAAAEEHDIRIIGLGHAVIDGGEYNRYGERSVPDGGIVGSYADNRKRLPKRLVHNSPIYLHNVRDFEVRGLHIRHQRYWGMCCSFCSGGQIRDIRFEADISYVSDDGTTHDPNRRPVQYRNLWIKNGDGIDLRTGCHDILVENISGWTEDDTVALTNLRGSEKADWVEGRSTDIHHVVVRNVRAGCWKWMNLVRLLCTDGNRIHDVVIDTVVDVRRPDWTWRMASAVQLNDDAREYSELRQPVMGEFCNIEVRNVFSSAYAAVRLFNPMQNVTVENVYLSDGAHAAVMAQSGAELRNVVVRNVHVAPTAKVKAMFDFFGVRGDLKVRGVRADEAENLERLADCDVKIDYDDVRIGRLTGGRTLAIGKGEPNCGGRWYKCDLQD